MKKMISMMFAGCLSVGGFVNPAHGADLMTVYRDAVAYDFLKRAYQANSNDSEALALAAQDLDGAGSRKCRGAGGHIQLAVAGEVSQQAPQRDGVALGQRRERAIPLP